MSSLLNCGHSYTSPERWLEDIWDTLTGRSPVRARKRCWEEAVGQGRVWATRNEHETFEAWLRAWQEWPDAKKTPAIRPPAPSTRRRPRA